MRKKLTCSLLLSFFLLGAIQLPPTRPDVYSAFIAQQGSDAPYLVEEYEDTFGVNVSFVREMEGYYSLNVDQEVFTVGDTRLMATIASDGVFHPFSVEALHYDEDTIQYVVADNGVLSDDWGLYLEIKVYHP